MTARLFSAVARDPSCLRAAARRLSSDCRLAWVNLLIIVRYSPPQMVQFLFSLWPVLWGIWTLSQGAGLWATAPRLYLWMHTGIFLHFPPAAWGLLTVGLGMNSLHALVWPSARRTHRVRAAVRGLCGMNAALAVGFGCSVFASPSWIFYGFLAAVFAWCLYRLSGEND